MTKIPYDNSKESRVSVDSLTSNWNTTDKINADTYKIMLPIQKCRLSIRKNKKQNIVNSWNQQYWNFHDLLSNYTDFFRVFYQTIQTFSKSYCQTILTFQCSYQTIMTLLQTYSQTILTFQCSSLTIMTLSQNWSHTILTFQCSYQPTLAISLQSLSTKTDNFSDFISSNSNFQFQRVTAKQNW